MASFKGQENFKLVEPNDFVISLRSFQGGIEHSQHRGIISPAYTVLAPAPEVEPGYYRHYLKSANLISRLNAVITGIRDGKTVKYEEFAELEIPLPPAPVQRTIADFLDGKTAAIDALIEKKERLIALLAEKRAALIHQAVTKGLDPTVPMRPSGIPWIGDIPAHWEVSSIRRQFTSLDSMRVPISTEERGHRQGPYPYYGASGIIDYVNEYLFDEPLVLVCEDGWNLVLRTQLVARPLLGKAWVNNHAHVLRPHQGPAEFWAAALEAAPFEVYSTGMRQPKLTADALKSIPIVSPPTSEEMQAVAEFIDSVAVAGHNLAKKLSDQLVRLAEYRQALITAAVTGQLDIPGAAA